jgi:nucleotide-binding universal stress UspA family protein
VAHYDPAGGAALVEAIEESERLALDRAVRETVARHPRVAVIGELHLGSGGAGILGYAADSALIVVGSHRRSMVGEIIAGSTGDDLIGWSGSIPVMITAPESGSAGSHDHQDDDHDHEDRDQA